MKLGGVSPGYGLGPGSAALIVEGRLVVEGDSGVTDRAGNPLAGPVTIRFTTATERRSLYLPTIAR